MLFRSFVGTPIEKGFALLPKQWNTVVNDATRKAIETALKVALWTLDKGEAKSGSPSNWWHKLAAGASGAAGGALGLAALSVELPVSTTIMLRSIADIARSEGENLKLADAQLECVQVLALGESSNLGETCKLLAQLLKFSGSAAPSVVTPHLLTSSSALAVVQ